jgi:hypothetical protein
MSTLVDLVVANQLLTGAVLTSVLLALLIYRVRRQLTYILQEIDYHLPLIGRASRLVRRRNHHPDKNGWFPAEFKVCADYYRFVRVHDVDRGFFNARRIYLGKVGELNRRPKPWYLWLLIVILIFAEAYGFSYVLALSPWAFASAAMRDIPWLAGSIAIVLAIAAVMLTEEAGKELYRNSAARRVRRDFASHPDNLTVAFQPSHIVRLDDDQTVDDQKLHCIQTLNRLERRPNEISHLWTIVAVAYIVGIAGFSTYVRDKAFERDMIQQQQAADQQRQAARTKVTIAPQLPEHLVQGAERAGAKATVDAHDIDTEGAWGSFLMLAFIFIALQTVAIMLGFKFGFAGKESEIAWRATHAFDGPQEYMDYHINRRAEITNQAQARLADLQGRIRKWVERHPTGGDQIEAAKNAGHRTFAVYVRQIAPILNLSTQERPQPPPDEPNVIRMGSVSSL